MFIGILKINKFNFCLIFICSGSLLFSQSDSLPSKLNSKKKSFYGIWGYNRAAYTTSTIHFKNKGTTNGINEQGAYDFEITDAKAHDSPDFDKIPDVINITIPQFNFRIGMWLNNKNDEGFELSYDHTKYVVSDGQTAHIKGNINGVSVNKDTLLERDNFHFEHTDGANFWMINYMKRNKIFYSKNNLIKLSYVLKPGFGILIPRTDVTLFGKHLNNNWKLAGITAGLETALRLDFYKHIVLEFSGKYGWANYINCFVLGKGNGKASQQFGYIESVFCLGFQF